VPAPQPLLPAPDAVGNIPMAAGARQGGRSSAWPTTIAGGTSCPSDERRPTWWATGTGTNWPFEGRRPDHAGP